MKCPFCGTKVKIIKTESRYTSNTGWRGTLRTEWDEVHFKCPKCNKTGTEDINHTESDMSFYSGSQPDG